MFLHIGNNQIIQTENIIGIFNVDSIKQTKEYIRLKESLEKDNKLFFNCEENEIKTFILTKENGDEKGYFSNISSFTIAKRNKIRKEKSTKY